MIGVERVIEAVSPRWAAKRAYYRSMLDMARAYDAAKTGRRTQNWTAGNGSANAELGTGAARIRARTRDLVRNNPWAATAVRKLATKVIGTGITPRLRAGRDEIERKRAAADNWTAFSENCDPEGQLDFDGKAFLAARTMFEAGEALVRFIPRPASWRLRVPLQIEVLEPDYLDSSIIRSEDNGNVIIQGVEYDPFGRRAAYWLFDEHPGEVITSARRRFALQSRRVPASDILHLFEPLRPGQARGVSVFTPVVLRMRDVDDYDDAELMKKKVAACFAAFVKRGAGATQTPLAGKGATADASGERVESLRPGRLQYLGLDEDIVFAQPPAADGFMEYMRYQLLAIAAGTGNTYEQLTGDYSNVNYSSMRGGMIDFWDLIDHLQWHVIIPQLYRPVWNRAAALLAATGRRNIDQPFEAIWTPPRRRWVDPQKEVAAYRDGIRSGLMTQRAAIAEQGEDPDEQIEEIAATNTELDELGIILDSDPRKMSRGGGATTTGDGTAAADGKKEAKDDEE